MVAIGRYMVAAAVALLALGTAAGQGRRIVAGLEGHVEYRALVEEEAALVRSADSVSRAVNELRRGLRDAAADRGALSADILRGEKEMLDMRSRMGVLASRINTIEQERALQNTGVGRNGGDAYSGGGSGTGIGNGANRGGDGNSGNGGGYLPANLVYGSYFDGGLPPEGLDELRRAQEAEGDLPPLVARYRENHSLIRTLAGEYDDAHTQAAADSIKTAFDDLVRTNATLDEIIGGQWGTIFDSKSYLYDLAADRYGRRDMLSRMEETMERLRIEGIGWQGVYASDAVTGYVLQKRAMTDYETDLARDLGNDAALDSLLRAAAALPRPEDLAGLEPVRLRERLFLDYSEVTVGTSPYGPANPIPQVKVYPRGIIYRIMVGNFSTPQAPSIFRGASPLSVEKTRDGRFRYFAGGFPTDSLARAAVERLRKAGFRNPGAVVWMDGVYIDPSADVEDENGQFYRIDVTGARDISPEIRGLASDADIVRGERGFSITPLDKAAAVRLRLALESADDIAGDTGGSAGNADPRHEIKLSKIPR